MSFIHRQRAFTLVELIATVAIIAILAVVLVVFVGDYLAQAKQTSDRQTLAVLNDALNRFKTQGGRLAALTSGASIGNVLNLLQTPVDWAGTTHQFLKTGTTYHAASLGAIGEGARFRFSKYGSYADGSVIGSDILSTYADLGYDVGDEGEFDEWITNAIQETGSSNYLALTNPDTTQLFQVDVRVANSGDKVRVWWGDGTTQDFDSIATGSNTAIYKDFGSAAKRTIVLVGNIDFIYSYYDDGRNDFGGDLTTLTCLESYRSYWGYPDSNTSVYGDLSKLPNLKYLVCHGQNTLSGDISGLTDMTYFSVGGNNTLTGDVGKLVNTEALYIRGNNTVSGSLVTIPNLRYTYIKGNNSVTYATTPGQHTWPETQTQIVITPGAAGVFTSEMVDSIIIDAAADTTTWVNEKQIRLTGNCGPRTSASDAAVAILQGRGVTVDTN